MCVKGTVNYGFRVSTVCVGVGYSELWLKSECHAYNKSMMNYGLTVSTVSRWRVC